MTAGRFNRFWTLVAILLVGITVMSSVVAWVRYRPEPPLEISIPLRQASQGRIYIGGAVNNPGIYPCAKHLREGFILAVLSIIPAFTPSPPPTA